MAEHQHVVRIDQRAVAAEADQRLRAMAQRQGQRHAGGGAMLRACGRQQVAMAVDVEQAVASAPAQRQQRAGQHAAVPAQHQRHFARFQDRRQRLGQVECAALEQWRVQHAGGRVALAAVSGDQHRAGVARAQPRGQAQRAQLPRRIARAGFAIRRGTLEAQVRRGIEEGDHADSVPKRGDRGMNGPRLTGRACSPTVPAPCLPVVSRTSARPRRRPARGLRHDRHLAFGAAGAGRGRRNLDRAVARIAGAAGQRPRRSPAPDVVVMRALGLVGVRYRYGGNQPETGLDCSGLVRWAYREVPGIELPRASTAMYALKLPRIEPAALAPGDLVFFRIGRHVSHVGIYIGDGRFVACAQPRAHGPRRPPRRPLLEAALRGGATRAIRLVRAGAVAFDWQQPGQHIGNRACPQRRRAFGAGAPVGHARLRRHPAGAARRAARCGRSSPCPRHRPRTGPACP